MPLADRTIHPVWLGRRPLADDEKGETLAPIAVCQNAVLGAIIQLASLVRHADDIFCDLTEECQIVLEKTESIGNKIRNVERIMRQLDSTEVKIPVGTLKEFSNVTDHHVARHGFDCDHFTPASRSHCIKFSYSLCEVTPIHALRGADLYRKDGQCSSHLFKLWPIALKDAPVRIDDMGVPTKFHTSLLYKKKYKTLKLKERRRTIHSIDEIMQESEPSSGDLQASKSDHMSKSQPSIVVSVNTSGAGFERMASFRQSQKSDEVGRDRKRRRRTVSGVPENIMQEIKDFEKSHRINREGPRQYSLDDLDQKDIDARDEVMQQYLHEIDAAIAEREEEEYAAQREAKLLKFLPCRRSRSLPRCVKLISAVRNRDGMTRSSLYLKKQPKVPVDEQRPKQPADAIHSKFSSSASLGSLSGGEGRSSRSSKRSSLIGDKLKSLVSNTIRPRPKSLDFDSIEVKDDKGSRRSRSKSAQRSASLSRMNSPSMPEGIMARAESTESQVGPGSYYYFDSNTLPRAQAKKYDFPWDSLPKDWTTSVKLREISKRRKEDRQSSSGNWSQSGYSSNRQSLDSDVKSSMPSATSQHSLGRDSGRDSPRSAGDGDGLDTGYMGDATSTESVSDTKSASNTDSDEWIRSLAERAAGRGDVTSTSAEALANLSRLTKQNIRNLDILVPGRVSLRQKRNELEDDGESSVYSLDQEGFYTSFHNDSGLRRSSMLLEEDEDLMMPRMRESKSLQSVASYSTVESVIFRPANKEGIESPRSSSSVSSPNLTTLSVHNTTLVDIHDIPDIDAPEKLDGEIEYGDTGTLKAKKKNNKTKKMPPLPPPRTTSIGDSDTQNSVDESTSNNADSPTSLGTSPESSDHETIYARLKLKTSISAHTFPSWCASLVSDEDDLQERLNAESSELEELFSSGTLPRSNVTSDSISSSSDMDHSANSWPRLKRLGPQQQGILKTPEKDKAKPVVSNTKILNFDPVVNLFDARSPHGVQLPLSRMSSSDESGSPPGVSTFDSHPLSQKPSISQENFVETSGSKNGKEAVTSGGASKYQPTFSLPSWLKTNKSRSKVGNCGQQISASTPLPNDHPATLTSGGPQVVVVDTSNSPDITSDISAVHSQSIPSIHSLDGLSWTPLSAYDKSADTLGSNSTIALSDIDSSSLTHVSLTDSTSGSTLSLNWDTDDTPNPTPMATPLRKPPSNKLSSAVSGTNNLDHNKLQSANFNSAISDRNISDKVQEVSVPSNSHHSVLPTSSPSSISQYQGHYNIPPSQPSASLSSSTLAPTRTIQPESGPVLVAPNPPPASSITNRATITNAAYVTPMQKLNDLNATSGSSSTNTRETMNDNNNNHKNKGSYFTFPNSASSLDSTEIDQSYDQSDRHNNNNNKLQSLPHSQSWSNPPPSSSQSLSYQSGNSRSRPSSNERRRSSPVILPVSNRTREKNPGTSRGGNENGMRRRSNESSYSPADSGFGSPSVFSQPNMIGQPYAAPTLQTQNHMSQASLSYKTSKVPQIKQPMFGDSRTSNSNFVPNLRNNSTKSEYPVKAHSSSSNESLNSQMSVNSAQPLISKTDLSQPVLYRGNSTESVHSNSSAGRSDSYRVAMLSDSDETNLIPSQKSNLNRSSGSSRNNNHPINTNPSSSRYLTKSLSTPAPAAYNDDPINRADSYRYAVQNTQSAVLGDLTARNSSYRLATCDTDVVTDSRMDACNLWTGKSGGTRDVRRMGITDIDQLKNYNNEPETGKIVGRRNSARTVDTLHSKKKLGIRNDSEGLINSSKTSQVDHKRFMKSNGKEKNKQKAQSSTYIRFDPIFESGEDLRASSESLRPPSITSIRALAKAETNETISSDNAHLIGQKTRTGSPQRRRSGSLGRKSDDRPGLSLLGSIKTTIKSIGGSKGE